MAYQTLAELINHGNNSSDSLRECAGIEFIRNMHMCDAQGG